MKSIKINLNQTATVILTKVGAEILNDERERTEKAYPQLKLKYKRYSEGEIYKTQIHSLFNDFGRHISIGVPVPFEGCEMDIELWEHQYEGVS